MRFVNDDVLETEFLEGGFFDEADLIARYAYFEILWYESVRDNLRALFLGPGEDDDVHVWSPLFKLVRPVLEVDLRTTRRWGPAVVLELGEE